MRLFRSLGTGGWKEAVLKIKMRKKLPAVTVALTAVSIFCFLMLAEAFFMMTSGGFNALAAQRTASQAEQNARIEVKRLENLDYAELSYLAEHPRQVMEGVEDGNWESEVTLGPEKNLSEDDNVKIRLAHVAIFRTGDSVTRYDVDVPLTSATGTTPIGSVMTWTSEGEPTTGGVWLECNGQTIPSKYKRLRELIGSKTPDYRGMFLRGYGSQEVYARQNHSTKGTFKWQKYSSGDLSEVQTDATRIFGSATNRISCWDDVDWNYLNSIKRHPMPLQTGITAALLPYTGGLYNPAWSDTSIASQSGYDLSPTAEFAQETVWALRRPPKKYQLHGHGGEHASYSLSEMDDTDSGRYVNVWGTNWINYNFLMVPVDDEIRPVNVAVRYFIKAR